MHIKDENANNQEQAHNYGAQQEKAPGYAQQQTRHPYGETHTPGFTDAPELDLSVDLFQLGTTPVGVPTHEQLEAMKENLAPIAKENGLSVTVVNQPSNLLTPLVLLSRKLGNTVTFKTLMLESLAKEIAPKYQNVDGERIQVERHTAHAHTKAMVAIASEAVAKTHNVSKDVVSEAGYEIIPKVCNLSSFDLANDQIVAARLLLDGIQYSEGSKLTAALIGAKKAEVGVRVDYMINSKGTTAYEANGMPVASDVMIRSSLVDIRQLDDDVNSSGQERVLSTAHLMMDYLYQENKDHLPNPNDPRPGYHPIGVITSSSAMAAGNCSESIMTHAFSIAFATAFLENKDNIAAIYELNPHRPNPAAFGYEHNLFHPQPCDFKKLTVVDEVRPGTDGSTIREILDNYLYPTMTMAMDMVPGSRSGASQRMFYEAAIEDGYGPANQAVIRELDRFTNNAFSARWGFRRVMHSAMAPVMFHVGHWFDQDDMRDLREVNYLNTLEGYGETVKQTTDFEIFASTFEPGKDTALGMNLRREIYQHSCRGLEVRGLGMRSFIEDGLGQALLLAFADCGMRWTPDGLVEQSQGRRGSGFRPGSLVDSSIRKTFNDVNPRGTGGRHNMPGFSV